MLRQAGLAVDPAATADFARAINLIGLAAPRDFHAAARAVFLRSATQSELFDELFRQFWLGGRRPAVPQFDDSVEKKLHKEAADIESPEDSGANDPDQTEACYSPNEILAHKDLAELSEQEIEQARSLLNDFIRQFARVRRRYSGAHRKLDAARVDLQRTWRRLLRNWGEPVELFFKRKRPRKARLLLLCDVSGSMESYSRFFLEFMFALRRELPRTEVAVFSTRATVITDLLEQHTVREVLAACTRRARDWGGGTDIGGSLAEFNRHYARTLVTSRSVVVLLSDGWDRGNPERMKAEIAKLRRRADSLIWLNPLLGSEGYQPLTQGMRTALPYLDYFLPAHNVNALAGFAQLLHRA